MVPVGLTLQPDEQFLELLDGLIHEAADYYEVAPETLWRCDEAGRLSENGYHRRFQALRARTGRPFVAHGVGLSLGTASPADRARTRQWLARLSADHAAFGFLWYTEHLGASSLAGRALTLPLPLPMNAHAAAMVRRRLGVMQGVVPAVGVENSVSYFLLGAPLDEADFLASVLTRRGTHLLLDLHNLYTMAHNFGFSEGDYLDRLPLAKVIELHVSGGADSEAGWLPSGRVMRLDSHDAAVPEPVWALLEQVLPRCPALRGVTLERMEGTVAPADVPGLRDELARARWLARRAA